MTLVWLIVFLGATGLRIAWAARPQGHRGVGAVLTLVAALDLAALLDRVTVLQTPWSVILIALVATALAEFALSGYRGLTGVRAHALRTARLLTVWGLLALALQPAIEVPPTREQLPTIAVVIDDSASMGLVDALAEADDDVSPSTRYQHAVRWWQEQDTTPESLVDQLRAHYEILPLRFADTLRGWPSTNTAPASLTPSGRTDLAGMLDGVLQQVGPEALYGVVVLTDGRHTTGNAMDASVARYRRRDIPVATVVMADETPPKDATWAELQVPETVFEGDRVVVRARLEAGGLGGQALTVRLLADEVLVDEREVRIPGDTYSVEQRFEHLPDTAGLHRYRLEIDTVDGERFVENNQREFEVAVSDDRVNVLLVDGRPRWEFRYLRNLLHRRDKSVHLQYLLTDPDVITGQQQGELVPASAARPFGESQAGALPENEEEWLAFDVILLGDLPPDTLSETDWDAIRKAVTERGALLVVIAGPDHMPHAHDSEVLAELLPVAFDASIDPATAAEPFRPAPTWTGRTHPAMQLGDPDAGDLWPEVEPFLWRHPGVTEVREGAEVLAWARSVEAVEQDAEPNFSETPGASVIVARRTGLGRVLWLATDHTWRLRYAVGDRYHHRFWGQTIRWGTGDRLRGGNPRIRIGSDQLAYFPGAEARVTVRLRDAERRPVNDADDAWIRVAPADDPEAPSERRVRLRYRKGSSGLYDAVFAAPETPGSWVIRPDGDDLEDLLENFEGPEAQLTFGVRAPDLSRELARLGLDRARIDDLARATGGQVVAPGEENALAPLWLSRLPQDPPPVYRAVWDGWPTLLVLLGLWSLEWALRRRGGLA